MSIEVTFQLSDADLEHFRHLMTTAIANAAKLPEATIKQKAAQAIAEMSSDGVPEFVTSRVASLEALLVMLDDDTWKLPEEERQEVLTSLAYFSEPEDLVPDHIPVLGYLDDAIMIELVVQDLSANIEAYKEFCEFREKEMARRGVEISTEDWLASKRMEMHTRMRKRRSERRGGRIFSRVF
ncbi:YkvA family protein [Bowmanella sp. JS7-9]|uniref:YkvA family protein n=1 Tax=Pseudobowmanella zhangzhouensis TaxID=1537679 RepID=A0ABW1XMA4_9ALTE|nr:YkvA family protein [Bowmanella sp. JS7-9]TBX21819.1 hypothetical protein TK45_09915 [Bowmanella sp. JS7-9]